MTPRGADKTLLPSAVRVNTSGVHIVCESWENASDAYAGPVILEDAIFTLEEMEDGSVHSELYARFIDGV